MKVLLCGLNFYLGRAALEYFQNSDNTVYGLVRDPTLLKDKMPEAIQTPIFPLDIIRQGFEFDFFKLPDLDIAFYFTQIPDLSDKIALHYEQLGLRNYINLIQRNGCNRIVYVCKSYAHTYLPLLEDLFVSLNVQYTIVMKDVSIGMGTCMNQYIDSLLAHRTIFLYKPRDKVYIRPVVLEDFLTWLTKVDWKKKFLNTWIKFSGKKKLEIEELIKLFIQVRGIRKRYTIIPIRNRFLAKKLNQFVYGINSDRFLAYIQEMNGFHDSAAMDWQDIVDFKFSPLSKGI
ncbi:hypothetical protein ACL9RF_00660 [Sphingobacterium sp. Mn56C]|uniref:hypothetical protein n=1 Tax=Sphingobacterium sp. Mn56C TaxID=3395261 RepID=UPI003BE94C04